MPLRHEIQIDPKQLEELKRDLGPELYAEAVGNAFTDLLHFAEGAVKEGTPVVFGNARRSTQSEVRKARAPDFEGRVIPRYRYATWLEDGEREDPRTGRTIYMKTQPGGYKMFEQGFQRTSEEAEDLLDAAGREIQERWSD